MKWKNVLLNSVMKKEMTMEIIFTAMLIGAAVLVGIVLIGFLGAITSDKGGNTSELIEILVEALKRFRL